MSIYKLSLSEYNDVLKTTEKFLKESAKFNNIHIEELRWFHHVHYCEKVLGYYFEPFKFESKLNEILAGYITRINGKVIVGYNTSDKIVDGRKHFSLCHEINHGIMHIDDSNTPVQFQDLLDNNCYDSIIEIEADVGASFLMINDRSLIHAFESPYTTINSLMDEFEGSKQFIIVRLKQFCKYKYNFNNTVIDKIIKIAKKDKPILHFLTYHAEKYFYFIQKHGLSEESFYKYIKENNAYYLIEVKNFALYYMKVQTMYN